MNQFSLATLFFTVIFFGHQHCASMNNVDATLQMIDELSLYDRPPLNQPTSFDMIPDSAQGYPPSRGFGGQAAGRGRMGGLKTATNINEAVCGACASKPRRGREPVEQCEREFQKRSKTNHSTISDNQEKEDYNPNDVLMECTNDGRVKIKNLPKDRFHFPSKKFLEIHANYSLCVIDRKEVRLITREELIATAALSNDINLVEAVLADGEANINMQDSNGRTPLHVACSKGFDQMVGILIAHGANVWARDLMGDTPLFTAVLDGNAHTILLLAQAVAASDINGEAVKQFVNIPNRLGSTALSALKCLTKIALVRCGRIPQDLEEKKSLLLDLGAEN